MCLLFRTAWWHWLRSPWCWGALLVVLCLAVHPASPTQAAVSSGVVPSGLHPLVALSPTAHTSPQAAQTASDCGVTDLSSCINDWITSFTQDTLANWFQQQVGIFESYGFIFATPDSLTYHAQPVQALYAYVLAVVGAFLTVLLAVAGFNHVLGRSTAWSETLPQVILCAVMAFAFQPFIAVFIQLGNDFIGGMQLAVGAQPTFPAYGTASNAFMDLIAFIIELGADLLLALEALARLALLDLLIVLAPLGILCYALPQTRGWGRLWAEAFAATILIQPLQATLVMLGAKMISLLGALLNVGLPPIVQILVGIASVSLALKVPSLLLSRATHVVSDFHHESSRLAMAILAAV